MGKKKDLNPRQKKFLKEVVKGKTLGEAAISAGYSRKNAGQSGHQVMKEIQKRAPEIMDAMGFNLETLIEKYLIPELDAQEMKVFNNGGKVVYSKKMPSHDIRLRALDLAFKLRGDYAPRDPVLAAQVGVKVIVVPKELRPDREKFYRQQDEEREKEP
jgi:Terminase small subunit